MTQDETLRWLPALDAAIAAFGEAPGALLEQEAIDAFRDDPEHVTRLLERIAAQHASKHFDSPWGIFRAELRKPKHDVVASTAAGKAKRVENAKRWIANAGLHYDLERDVEAELFGDDYQRGRLHDYRSDDKLRAELLAYWHEQRPRGEQAERDHQAWAAHCVESRKRVAVMLAAKRQEDECSTTSGSHSSGKQQPKQPDTATTPTPSQQQHTSQHPEQEHPTTPMTPDAADDIPHFTPAT